MMRLPETFRAWLAKRTPNVRERIERLNPVFRLGERGRGYHPHRRAGDPWRGETGKRAFIEKYGREAWAALPRFCVQHDGRREYIRYEDERDMVWTIPSDHPIRRARRVGKGLNAQWLIPEK